MHAAAKALREMKYLLESDGVGTATTHGLLQHRLPEINSGILELVHLQALLYDILNSDMAQREEDEGQKSELLERVRKAVA